MAFHDVSIDLTLIPNAQIAASRTMAVAMVKLNG
jgi:hypothetical protein